MFTGIVKDLGKIISMRPNTEGLEFVVESKLINDIAIDDSVAINGVCQTVTKLNLLKSQFSFQSVKVTLDKTNFKNLKVNDLVNIELCLRPIDRFGGHFVQGHVNTTSTLQEIKNLGKNKELWFTLSQSDLKYVILEGSISINGVSLTIAEIEENLFMTTIIPHTAENTNLGTLKVEDVVNIEFDLLGKYIESFINKKNINEADWNLHSFFNQNKFTKEWFQKEENQ